MSERVVVFFFYFLHVWNVLVKKTLLLAYLVCGFGLKSQYQHDWSVLWSKQSLSA
jgi:hypothetical protein